MPDNSMMRDNSMMPGETGTTLTSSASPESIVNKEDKLASATVAQVAGAAPQMKTIVQVADVQELVNAIDSVMDRVTNGSGGHIPYRPESRSKSVRVPLPNEVWVPLFGITGAIKVMATMPGGEVVAQYVFDPMDAADGTKMADATGLLNRLSMDDKAIKFIQTTIIKTTPTGAKETPAQEAAEKPSEQGPTEEAGENHAPSMGA